MSGVCSPEKEKGERARLPSWQDEDPSWESFLGHSQEAANILIRWPDGSRDSWAQPADTKLRSLLLFISTKVRPNFTPESLTTHNNGMFVRASARITTRSSPTFPGDRLTPWTKSCP